MSGGCLLPFGFLLPGCLEKVGKQVNRAIRLLPKLTKVPAYLSIWILILINHLNMIVV